MAVLLVVIICPIIFGICFLSQTIYFIYKILNSRNTDYSGSSTVTTIHMTDAEATCCMGWAWTSCIDKRTNRITLKTFIAWYLVATCLDIVITVIFFFVIRHFDTNSY
ncbi:unnamed protein product [Rotaria sp. Silwood2]|nr:unnamed protein product [Rotaria sp. Silwood2]CAF4419575.1 unnamed protein product [Rotaria sp. Silwood2]